VPTVTLVSALRLVNGVLEVVPLVRADLLVAAAEVSLAAVWMRYVQLLQAKIKCFDQPIIQLLLLRNIHVYRTHTLHHQA
jgi:hypothetical protein